MATEKQTAANRRNAKRCTGPKTREGKFKSSLNAWRRNRVTELTQLRINNAIDSVLSTSGPIDAPQLTLRAFEKLENDKPSFARQEAQEVRLVNLFHRTQRRLEASQDRKIRNETNLGLNSLSLAA